VDTLAEVEDALVGGHTITSDVPIFGLSVIGTVHPDRVMLISRARPGDVLIMTKPLGTGIIAAAQKAGVASPQSILAAERVMMTSNRRVAELAVQAGINTATDVTGYGLIGHLQNMLKASGCSASIRLRDIPVIPESRDALEQFGMVPNSAERSYFALRDEIEWSDTPVEMRLILSDPQTSGGLLLSAGKNSATTFINKCREQNLFAYAIGEVHDDKPGTISIAG
jgi:selenide,water dikinase